jgi:hypothetical protein
MRRHAERDDLIILAEILKGDRMVALMPIKGQETIGTI